MLAMLKSCLELAAQTMDPKPLTPPYRVAAFETFELVKTIHQADRNKALITIFTALLEEVVIKDREDKFLAEFDRTYVTNPKTIPPLSPLIAEEFINQCFTDSSIPAMKFFTLLLSFGEDFDTFYRQYVSEAVLKRFRKSQGEDYNRNWNGTRDRIVVNQLARTIPTGEGYTEALADSLGYYYRKITGKGKET